MNTDLTMTFLAAGLSESSASLLRDFTVAMVIAAAGLALARLVRQPPVLGYLLAGMLIGPFTLPTPLISNQDTIGLLAELGLILLLFGIGLELGWRRIRGIGIQVLVIGVVEISVLTLLGIWVVSILPGIDASLAPYLGGALAISSSAILLKGLRDGGNLNARWGQTIVGILLVEDFAAVILKTVLGGPGDHGGSQPDGSGIPGSEAGNFLHRGAGDRHPAGPQAHAPALALPMGRNATSRQPGHVLPDGAERYPAGTLSRCRSLHDRSGAG